MNTLLLAAGQGSRLRPLTNDLPKPLLEVSGVSLISRLIESMSNSSLFGRVFVNISHLPHKFVATRIPGNPIYLYEQRLLGPTKSVLNLLEKEPKDLLVIHGDLLLETHDLHAFAHFCQRQTQSQIVVHKRDLLKARSLVLFDDTNSVTECSGSPKTRGFEKLKNSVFPANNSREVFSDSGIYFLKSDDTRIINPSLEDTNIRDGIMTPLMKEGLLRAYRWPGRRLSIETVDDLNMAQHNWPSLISPKKQ